MSVRIVKLLSTIAICLGIPTPVLGADTIHFSWGALDFPISVKGVETFADKGEITPDLKLFLSPLSPKQRGKLRQFLRSRYRVNPVVVSRLGYTTVGTELLTSLGEIITTSTGQNGLYALRSAVILSAMNPEGITPIDLLKQLPVEMRVDLGKLLQIQKQIATLGKETKKLIGDNWDTGETSAAAIEIKQPGRASITQKSIFLTDNRPDWQNNPQKILKRKIHFDLYLPETPRDSVPIIMVSNGLGAKRDRFKYLGEYLASHGFAVIVPDHPGSDRQRQKDFYQGLYSENFNAGEFIDRPLDISFILDTLQESSDWVLQNKLDFNNVGIFGYSFGGATALSLAGGEIDRNRLITECASTQKLLNISLLYQCRALELPNISLKLRDKRIKGIYLFVPFSSILFNQDSMSRINVPILWSASDQDLVTPLLLEQLPAFEQLETQNKYAIIFQKLPHTFVTRPENDTVSVDRLKEITKSYHRILSLAFFGWHLQQNSSYRPYLTPQGMKAWGTEGYQPILLP
ncbi:MAG: alpha/beta fold hydrolase [Xenococcaceae cyanobacterium MO_188.B19]|nr:alpha/beta fold hydrolase [Xenococcaceae cyanobacterium MO_188.B19]